MKIKTITCHDVYNYGASLQAYALMHYLQKKGNEVEIIDYKPDYLTRHYKLSVVNPVYNKPIIRQLYLLAKLFPYLRSLKRKKLFDDFTTKYLRTTSECYHSNGDLKMNPPIADLYLAGSDQIWNTLFPNGKDPAFYLDFVPNGKIKASYAASMATDKVVSGWEGFVCEKVMNLDKIAVREDSAVSVLESIGVKKEIWVVCDPVFLLPCNHWETLLSSKINNKKPYIFVYDFENSKSMASIAQYIAEKKALEVISIGSLHFGTKNNKILSTGPLEFLSYIYNAEYIISNSFHATAFSILFKKQFYVKNRTESLNVRMKDLLKTLNLSNRLVCTKESVSFENIDYTEVQVLLDCEIRKSQQYLDSLIQTVIK